MRNVVLWEVFISLVVLAIMFITGHFPVLSSTLPTAHLLATWAGIGAVFAAFIAIIIVFCTESFLAHFFFIIIAIASTILAAGASAIAGLHGVAVTIALATTLTTLAPALATLEEYLKGSTKLLIGSSFVVQFNVLLLIFHFMQK